jgi:hypothetical protein
MPATVDDIMEAATNGVIRALDARKAGQKTESVTTSASDLVRSGFYVNVHIIAGGYPPGPPWEMLRAQALNPQPLPPG